MAAHYPGCHSPGHVGKAWATAMQAAVHASGTIALLAPPEYIEDQQVIAYLGSLLQDRGFALRWAAPHALVWRGGEPAIGHQPIHGIVRFFQAEWLHPRQTLGLFAGGRVPVCNPGIAALTESKRFPLVWHELDSPMPTWHRTLPQTRDPRNAPWKHDDSWLLKSAYCNNGDDVLIRSMMAPSLWRRAAFSISLRPRRWIAQRRFTALPIPAPVGDVHPCIGVYTIDGRVAGAYGRCATRALIDSSAIDAAVLIEDASRS
jgi:hypothetical protein